MQYRLKTRCQATTPLKPIQCAFVPSKSCTRKPHNVDSHLPRRTALLSIAILGFSALAQQARSEECQLTESPNGIQFCDLTIGDGEPAVSGTMIK